MTTMKLIRYCAISFIFTGMAVAHGGAHQKPVQADANANWATKHMAEEHHISNFDAGAFFKIHDYDENGEWDGDEIIKTYGLMHESNKDVSQHEKNEVLDEIYRMMDIDRDHRISREEWMNFIREGGTLPDFGFGPGHHGDDEYEYEIHHWEKYHDENTTEEDLIHPEDIEHFKKHDEVDDELNRVAQLDKMQIVEQNIPVKFRRN